MLCHDSRAKKSNGKRFSSTTATTVSIDVNQLLNDTVITAGLGLIFDIEVDLNTIKGVVDNGTSIGNALLDGIGLRIESWNATAALVVDPFSLRLDLGDQTLAVRNTSFLALELELESSGPFFSSIGDLGSADASPLVPELVVPFHAETIFDLNVGGMTLSPVLKVSSEDLTEDIDVAFDLDLGSLIDDISGSVFNDLTELLRDFASFGPDLTAGSNSLPIEGLFGVVQDVSDFASALGEFSSLVQAMSELIPPEVRSVVRHANRLSKDGCLDSSLSVSFTEYVFDLLTEKGLLDPSAPRDDFNPCEHVGQIQVALGYTSSVLTDASFADLVVLTDEMQIRLEKYFGNGTSFSGDFLLEKLGSLSVSKP